MSSPWLASGSPRRRQLLTWAGWEVEVHPPDVDETVHPHEDPVAYALRLAREKAATAPGQRLALAADTVVHRDGQVFDKPSSREMARAHLLSLSDGWHAVTTGFCVRRGPRERSLAITSRVRFRVLTPPEVSAYVASGEADDKAGAYGIQGRGGSLVAEVRGSWTNVMGLPLEEVLEALADLSR